MTNLLRYMVLTASILYVKHGRNGTLMTLILLMDADKNLASFLLSVHLPNQRHQRAIL